MLAVLLDVEIGVGELLTGVLVIGVGYLAWQWWSAKKLATSGVTSPHLTASPMSRGAGAGAGATGGGSGGAQQQLPLSIFFGSQSGTAETFAHELAEEGKVFGFKAQVHDLQDFDHDSLSEEKFAVFLISTFGEGDPPDNAAEFCEWVHSEDREPAQLAGVTYGVFALGNRQYEHFCSVGRRVDHRLNELGATRMVELGEGDDDGSLEDDFSAWKSNFWARTKLTFGLAEGSAAAMSFKPSFAIDFKSAEAAVKYMGGLTPAICDPRHKPILATVVENRQLRADVTEGTHTNNDGDSTRHLELDLSALRLSYVTADNLGVCPRNDDDAVARLCQRLQVSGGSVFSLKALGKRKYPVQSPCSVHDALQWYLDFQSVPRGALLTTLAQYTDDPAEKALLHSWTHEGKEEFLRDEKSILEVLEALPTLAIPFVDFLELCPKLQPRFYTISSSSLVQPKQVAITVALSTHHKPRGRVYRGLATTFLCGLNKGQQVCVFLRPSTFRLPKPKRNFAASPSPSPSPPPSSGAPVSSPVASPNGTWQSAPTLPPIIMVGPGTGVAPFRAFTQEFAYLRAKDLASFPSTHLFFGCRHRAQDYIYQDEFESALESGALTQLHTAFSRDSEQKVYVQSDLKAHAEQVWRLLSAERAYFYVCGGTVMGRQVKECIQHIAMQHGNLTQQAATEWLKKITSEGRYIQELWS